MSEPLRGVVVSHAAVAQSLVAAVGALTAITVRKPAVEAQTTGR